MKFQYITIIVASIIIFTSCSKQEVCEEKFSWLDQKIQKRITEKFQAKSIFYKNIDKYTLCVTSKDSNYAHKIISGVLKEMVPQENSRSLDPGIMERVEVVLNRKNIPYEKYIIGHGYTLVWDSRNANIVKNIIETEIEKFLDEHKDKPFKKYYLDGERID